MLPLLAAADLSDSIFYAVINPEDNSVEKISPSITKMTNVTDCSHMQLHEIIGCFNKDGCKNSIINIKLGDKDKVVHIVDCKYLLTQFFVIKFKVLMNGGIRHIVIYTEADSVSSDLGFYNNLDNMLTHEVKNVLNNLSLINQNIISELTETERAELEELIKMSDENIQSIEKILQMYKNIKEHAMQESFYSNEVTRICTIVKEAANAHSVIAEKKRLKPLIKAPVDECKTCLCHIKYNNALIYLLFSNLINNAYRYAPENSCVTISMTHSDDRIITTIENDGMLDDGMLENFFSKYSKGEFSDGTGFGTYCSKLITDLYQGEIYVQNSDNRIKLTVSLATS